MVTTLCPICNHPTRFDRSNPNQWECMFCGTKASSASTLNISTMTMCYDKNGRLNSTTTTEPVPGSSTIVEKPGGLKYDDGKLQYGLIPPIATRSLAQVLTFGAAKYAPNSWQTVQDGERRYLDALYRHLEAYRSGESTDSESGLSHLAHAITNVAFLLHFEQEKATNASNAI